MAETLILMRHGKAQRPADGKPDIERQLSAAGKRALRASLPSSIAFMQADMGQVEIWSSPAARAEQTARIMLNVCKDARIDVYDDVRINESLWTQDLPKVLEEVRASSAHTVVAVGHNPFIEDATASLSGSRIVFATGALATLKLDSGNEGQAIGETPQSRLLWFAQGPISQNWKTLVCMERVLAESADAVSQRLDAFTDDPNDPETMHKFRVSIRTVRSLVAFIEPWQNPVQNGAVQNDFKAIVSKTSRLRELDVLAQQAQDMEGASEQLVAYTQELAANEREKVLKDLTSKRTAKRLESAITRLHNVKWKRKVESRGLPSEAIRTRFDELAENLNDELITLDLSDVEKTHDVRKNAKRVRYDAEKFSGLVGADALEIAKGMTAHQDNLGSICDARVNIDIINGLPLHDLPDAVAWDLALLRAENETYLYRTLRQG